MPGLGCLTAWPTDTPPDTPSSQTSPQGSASSRSESEFCKPTKASVKTLSGVSISKEAHSEKRPLPRSGSGDCFASAGTVSTDIGVRMATCLLSDKPSGRSVDFWLPFKPADAHTETTEMGVNNAMAALLAAFCRSLTGEPKDTL